MQGHEGHRVQGEEGKGRHAPRERGAKRRKAHHVEDTPPSAAWAACCRLSLQDGWCVCAVHSRAQQLSPSQDCVHVLGRQAGR